MIFAACVFYFALSLTMYECAVLGAKSRMMCANANFVPQRSEEVESTSDGPRENYQGIKAEAKPSAHILYNISAPNVIPQDASISRAPLLRRCPSPPLKTRSPG